MQFLLNLPVFVAHLADDDRIDTSTQNAVNYAKAFASLSEQMTPRSIN